MKLQKTTSIFITSIILSGLFLLINSCSQENPVPTVPNTLTAEYNSSAYGAPATYVINTQTVSGVSYNQIVITSANSTPISLTFSYTNVSLTSLAGISYSADGKGTYILGNNIYQTAKSGIISATSGTVTITSFDNQLLNGTFNFVGPTFTVTNGKLINVRKF